MEKTIAVIWGDCSSPEIVAQAVRVLDRIAENLFGFRAVRIGRGH